MIQQIKKPPEYEYQAARVPVLNWFIIGSSNNLFHLTFGESGARDLYLNEQFQRYYQDAKAGSNHIAIRRDRCGSTYGRVALSLDPGIDEI